MNWILAPTDYSFVRFGLLAAVIIGVTCATLGAYVVLRRMAFIGHALTHSTMPGLVIAYLCGWNLLLGAGVAILATALGIGWLSARRDVHEDTAIGVSSTAMFALGILLMSRAKSYRDFSHILFGNILGVTKGDLILVVIVGVVVITILFLFHKEIELYCYDPTHARVIGINTSLLHYGFLILLSLAIVTGLDVVGPLLMSALLVTPVVAAFQLTNRLTRAMFIAAILAVFAGIAGIYSSYYLSLPSGASIVMASTLGFILAWSFRRIRSRA